MYSMIEESVIKQLRQYDFIDDYIYDVLIKNINNESMDDSLKEEFELYFLDYIKEYSKENNIAANYMVFNCVHLFTSNFMDKIMSLDYKLLDDDVESFKSYFGNDDRGIFALNLQGIFYWDLVKTQSDSVNFNLKKYVDKAYAYGNKDVLEYIVRFYLLGICGYPKDEKLFYEYARQLESYNKADYIIYLMVYKTINTTYPELSESSKPSDLTDIIRLNEADAFYISSNPEYLEKYNELLFKVGCLYEKRYYVDETKDKEEVTYDRAISLYKAYTLYIQLTYQGYKPAEEKKSRIKSINKDLSETFESIEESYSAIYKKININYAEYKKTKPIN